MSVEFRIEIQHGNINLRVISIQIAYKAMRLNEITEEASVKKNERGKNQVSRPENSNIKSSRERGSNNKTREREEQRNNRKNRKANEREGSDTLYQMLLIDQVM